MAHAHAPHHHDHNHDHDHTRLHLAAAFKGRGVTLGSLVDKPVMACFGRDKLAVLAASDPNIISVRNAITNPPSNTTDRAKLLKRAAAAGLDVVPNTGAPSSTGLEGQQDQNGGGLIKGTHLDRRFRIGFSRLYGHAVELNRDDDNNLGVKAGRIESGTYVFQQDEMPYACAVQDVWKGKLCEECLRLLPKDPKRFVECPTCPNGGSSTTARESASPSPLSTEGVDAQETGDPSKFCSQACLHAAWKAWHGYECGLATELSKLQQLTRLALRVYWRNVRQRVPAITSLAPSTESASLSLATAAAALSLEDSLSHTYNSQNHQEQRIRSVDGSDILPSQLCHNFKQLDPVTRISFMMAGCYLQQLLDLPGDAALELAHLHALVKFNSFAIKSQVVESTIDSDPVTQMNDYAIGSALYLLASMFNHSCAPNAMVLFGRDGKTSRDQPAEGVQDGPSGPDPRMLNVVTNRALKVHPDLPILIEISYGPQGGRMGTEERKECLRRSHLFECDCSACNDRYAEAVLQKIYKCPKNGYACRPLTETDRRCPTCGTEIDMHLRHKMHQLMSRLLAESQDPSLTLVKRRTLLSTLESVQLKTFVDTCILYGNTCDQLAMVYMQAGDANKSIEWCKKALKVVVVHFPHDSIEVAQETLKLAGLLFNNMQTKEAMKQVQIAITLYKGHYGANSRHPDLLELYEMEKVLKSIA